jgi:formamidopyrimidine-DNA glycosylase
MQKIGFMNLDLGEYDRLVGGVIKSAVSRGNTIHISLNNKMNLLIGPEYGGKVLYYEALEKIKEKYHLRVDFTDNTSLTIRLKSMGIIKAVSTKSLESSYLYKRDFSDRVSPLEETFTLETFSDLISWRNQQLKQVLVGKNAVLVGMSNSAYQDVIYRAKLHPKKKASELSEKEKRALYSSIKLVMDQRIKLGGKNQFLDIYGRKGCYSPAMGPTMKGLCCSVCGTPIERISHGGGQVYLCPICQKE